MNQPNIIYAELVSRTNIRQKTNFEKVEYHKQSIILNAEYEINKFLFFFFSSENIETANKNKLIWFATNWLHCQISFSTFLTQYNLSFAPIKSRVKSLIYKNKKMGNLCFPVPTPTPEPKSSSPQNNNHH